MMVSYHNHSQWSDGQTSIAEMFNSASALGLCEFGISDHVVIHPHGKCFNWAMNIDRISEYHQEANNLQSNSSKCKLRIGLEVDFFIETLDKITAIIEKYPFDFIIGSVHIIDDFSVDENSTNWEILSQNERNKKWVQYWDKMIEMVKSGVFDIVGHFDLPKKFGFRPTIDLSQKVAEVLDTIANSNMTLELNTSGWYFPAQELYPSENILKEAYKRDIPIIISADAHFPEHVSRDFEKAIAIAKKVGFSKLCRFEKRKRYSVSF